jgi:hypothetical protein
MINASTQRVWNVLTKALYLCLPMEKMKIIDENSFSAELPWKLFLIPLRLYLYGKFVDILPFENLSCSLIVKRGVLKSNLKVIFNLGQTNEGLTRLTCSAIVEDKKSGGLAMRCMRRSQVNFVEQVFHEMKFRLKQLC